MNYETHKINYKNSPNMKVRQMNIWILLWNLTKWIMKTRDRWIMNLVKWILQYKDESSQFIQTLCILW